jgi:hypothetical protein
MSDYSGYQIKRPHSLSPLTSVYEATATDGRPGRFALKVFHPPASTSARRLYAIQGWLLAAERQQLYFKKDGAALEVLACGRCAEGAFAVTPWQEHFLEPLVKTLTPKGDTLRALAECLLNSLAQWEAQAGGPHGNLKAANIFLSRTGALTGMTAQFSDPSSLPGGKVDALRQADLAALGTILAQIVRRRPPGAWPIEEAPEWKALGNGGKGWLAFCNYLLNPQPKEGELTITEARRQLKKIPADANPAKMALLTMAAVLALGVAGLAAFARFGNPIYMPDQLEQLAIVIGNPRAKVTEVPRQWADLCQAWDTWLVDLQSNGPRLLRTEGLWERDDPLRKEIEAFLATANELRPEALVPEAASEKRLGVLGKTPPPAVLSELLTRRVDERVRLAGSRLVTIQSRLGTWSRWEQLRTLQKLIEARGFTSTASALAARLPQARGTTNYKFDIVRTLKLFNDLSLDDTGALLLSNRWSEFSRHIADMEASGDRVQKAMPALILGRLADRSSIADFTDTLADPLEEMRRRRMQFLDPSVVRERFLKESPLQAETAAVTVDDFPRWDQELVLFSKVVPADDPRLAAGLDASVKRLPTVAVDLEADAPAAEPGGLPTLSTASFDQEFKALTAGLQALRAREIVRRDLPVITEETTKAAAAFGLLEQRLEATMALLKPEIWLARVNQAVGHFTAIKERWAAWQQATLNGVTAAALSFDRPRFRQLRASERQIREWLDGVEGPTGFGALPLPDLKAASPDTATALGQLEAARREQAVMAVAAAAEWRDALPSTPWASASEAVRAPLEAHRTWLAGVADFATSLDHLNDQLVAGFGWADGVSETATALARHAGLDQLTGPPAAWHAEAQELEKLVGIGERNGLTTAAQSGGLSRKLMAWRRLGALAGWPAGPEDFDFDGTVVTVMRAVIQRDLKDEARRGSLLDELVKETRLRWNRAARAAARSEAQLTAMFERMKGAGIADADLDEPVAYNLALWRFKHADWNEANLGRLRIRRDAFVESIRAIRSMPAQPEVGSMLEKLSAIELVGDPNLPPIPSTLKNAGWEEELTNEGLSLTATWAKGGKKVQLEYNVVQPTDGSPAFYLAKRAVAVGEFVNLLSGGVKHAQAELVLNALPKWTKGPGAKPWNKPLSWRPREDGKGFEVNPTWIYLPNSQVKPLLDNADLRARTPALDQVVAEKPTARSPLQLLSPDAAKLFVEKVLGARLPKLSEWRTVTQLAGATPKGFFRGASFQNLWRFLDAYKEGGQSVLWRPNEGVYLPKVSAAGNMDRKAFKDDGQVGAETDTGKLWFASVDEGPDTGGFINLYGNVWIYLQEGREFYVAGGSALSPPGKELDPVEPHKVEPSGEIGATKVGEGFSDVGLRPAFDAPPGFKERYRLLVLVREQKYLTL